MRPRALARLAAKVEKLNAGTSEAFRLLREDTTRLREDVHNVRRQTERDGETVQQQARNTEAIGQQIAEFDSSIHRLTKTVASMHDSLQTMQNSLQKVQLRAEQLVVITRANTTNARRFKQLPALLQADRARAHVTRALQASEIRTDPFPHLVVDNILPTDLYNAVIAAIPPRALFEDRRINKQQVHVPPHLAPIYSRRVWRFIVNEIVERQLKPDILVKFREPLTEYLQRFWPKLRPDDPNLALIASDGRIILRRPGYVIPPHRDPRWGWLTTILYLARPGDPDTWGTQLYYVREDVNAPSAQPYWIGESRCELVTEVPFLPNRARIFLNSEGAHGASIPADAPPEFERYIYQWRIGPRAMTMRRLMAELTPDMRAAWEGKEGY